MTALALTVLGASLLGSLHCAGMCGGLVAVYAGGLRGGAGRGLAGHLAYNLGRLVAYAGLGAAAGVLGAAVDVAGRLAGLGHAARMGAGVLIVVWGGLSLAVALGARVPRLDAPDVLRGLAGRVLRRFAFAPPAARALALGLVTGGLPCGWLYAFVVTAAGTGSAPGGASVMAMFWLGTLPVMASLGAGLQALAGPLRRHLPVASAVAMMLVGAMAVAGRLADAPAPEAPGHGAAALSGPAGGHGGAHGHR